MLYHIIGACVLLSTISAQAVGPCTGRPPGFFQSDPSACNAYHVCGPNGVAIERGTCPAPFMFHQNAQKCDWSENVSCFECDPTQQFSQTPVAGSCIHFIRCIGTVATLEACPSGLQFDAANSNCNLQSVVNCAPAAANRCPPVFDPTRPVFFADDADCNRYWVCLASGAEQRTCAPTLHFNIRINQCDTAANANCTINGGTPPPDNGNGSGFSCPAVSAAIPIYPRPGSCFQYYICAGGIAHPQECTDGTRFDPQLKRCVLDQPTTCFRK